MSTRVLEALDDSSLDQTKFEKQQTTPIMSGVQLRDINSNCADSILANFNKHRSYGTLWWYGFCSGFFKSETLVRLSRYLLVSLSKNSIFWIKVSKKIVNLIKRKRKHWSVGLSVRAL